MVPYVQLSTNCRIGFWYNENKICTVIKLSSPQLVENSTYGTIAFPCIKSSLDQIDKQNKIFQHNNLGKEASLLSAVIASETIRIIYTIYRAGFPHPEMISEIGTPDSC